MKKNILLFILASMMMASATAQEIWPLSKCLEYALKYSKAIEKQVLVTTQQENFLQRSRDSRLPSLNLDVTQNFAFGRLETNDNILISDNGASTSFGLVSDVPLYKGGQIKHEIEKQEFAVQASYEELQQVRDAITLNITKAYLEILFAQELVKGTLAQLELTTEQIRRTRKLVNAGTVAEGVLLEIKAQEARESLAVVNAQNQHNLALLTLVQALELDDYSNFAIEEPMLPEIMAETSMLSAKTLFETAVENRAEIKEAEYQFEMSVSDLEIQRARRLPSLSAYFAINDGYYTNYDKSMDSFGSQMRYNQAKNVGLQLKVPIFNRYMITNDIQNAKLNIEMSLLELDDAKKSLRREIEQAYMNTVTAFKRYNANKVAVRSMEESYRYVEKKFELGRVNSLEFNDVKTRLTQAQSDLLQAKYEFIFSSKILDYYNGTPIEL